MAYRLIEVRIAKLGFCCPNAYFSSVRNMSTPEIAAELGVHKRSARRWRSNYRAGYLGCQKQRDCFLTPALPAKCPCSIPVHVEGLDLVQDA